MDGRNPVLAECEKMDEGKDVMAKLSKDDEVQMVDWDVPRWPQSCPNQRKMIEMRKGMDVVMRSWKREEK